MIERPKERRVGANMTYRFVTLCASGPFRDPLSLAAWALPGSEFWFSAEYSILLDFLSVLSPFKRIENKEIRYLVMI